MPDNLTQIVEYDVSQALGAVTKLEKVLASYGQTVDDVEKIEARLNKTTGDQQLLVKTQIDEFTHMNTVLEKHGAFWVELKDKTQKYADSLKLVSRVQQEAAEAEAKLTASIEKQNRININIRRQAAEKTIGIIQDEWEKRVEMTERYARLDARIRKKYDDQVVESMRQAALQRRIASNVANSAGPGAAGVDPNSITALIKEEDIGKHEEHVNRVVQANQKLTLSFASLTRLLAIQIIHQALSRLKEALFEAVHDATEFQIRVSEIQTISQQANLATSEWTSNLRLLSDQFGSPILQVAEGAYQALSNQVVHGADTFKFLNEEMKLSLITVSSLRDAVAATTAVMNSYGQNTDSVEHINAVLFKTVELGRVRLEQMADQLGKVSTLSHQLGLSFEEQQAALVLLTQKGLQFTTAQTLVDNVLLKLAKPTKEMTELFKQWGVQSGEAAIRTYGFVGVLQKLEEATKGGADGLTEIADVFRDLRAIVGGDILTNTDQYRKILDKFHESTTSAAKALDIVLNNQGKTLQIELNRIKNFFTVDLGNSIINYLTGGAKGVGHLSDTVIGLTHSFVNLVETIILFKTAMTAANYAISIYNTYAKLSGTTSLSMIEGMTQAEYKAKLLQASITNLAKLGFAVLIYYVVDTINELGRYYDKLDNAGSKALEQYENATSHLTETIISNIDAQRNAADQAFDEQLRGVLQYVAKVDAANEALTENIKKQYKSLVEQNAIAFKEGFREIEETIRSLETEANKATRNAEHLKDDAERTRESLEDRKFHAALEAQSPEDQIKTLRKQISLYFDEADKLLQQGDIELANKRFARLARLEDELQNKLRKEVLDNNKGGATDKHLETLNKRLNDVLNKIHEVSGQKGNVVIPDEHRLKPGQLPKTKAIHIQDQTKLNNLLREEREIEAEIAKIVNARGEGAIKNQGIDKERLDIEKELEDRAQKRAELEEKISTAEAERAKQLKEDEELGHKILDDLRKQLDIIKHLDATKPEALDEFQKALDEVHRLEAQSNLSTDAQIKLDEQLQKERTALADAAARERAKHEVQIVQNKVEEVRKLEREATTNRANAEKNANTTISDSQKVIIEDLTRFLEVIKNSTLEPSERFTKETGLGGREDINKVLEAAIKLAKSPEIQKGDAAALKIQQDQLARITKVIQALEKFEVVERSLLGKNPADDSNSLILKKGGIGEKDRTTTEAIRNFVDAGKKISEALAAKAKAEATANEFFQNRVELEKKLSLLADKTLTVEETKFKHEELLLSRLIEVEKAFEQLAAQMFKQLHPDGIQHDPIPGFAKGGLVPQYLAYGGFPGGPRGTDTIPAWLSPGEYVLDALTVKKFYPLIKAMHQPIYRSSGGPVTSVGDINITVQGGQSSEMTIRQIGQGLRREIRRGTLLPF